MGEPRAGDDARGNERTAADGVAAGTRLLDADLTGAVIGAFYRVYKRRGFGFLESVHREALRREIRKLGLLLHFGPAPRVHRVIHTINSDRSRSSDPH